MCSMILSHTSTTSYLCNLFRSTFHSLPHALFPGFLICRPMFLYIGVFSCLALLGYPSCNKALPSPKSALNAQQPSHPHHLIILTYWVQSHRCIPCDIDVSSYEYISNRFDGVHPVEQVLAIPSSTGHPSLARRYFESDLKWDLMGCSPAK